MIFVEKILNFSVFRKTLYKLYKLVQIGSLKKMIYRDDKALDEIFASFASNQTGTSLDIGSGPAPRNPFNAGAIYGADLRRNENKNVLYADLSSGFLPFENEMFDYVTAYDVLEHIPRVALVNNVTGFPFISLMNEIFRVLKPGGIFFCMQPCFPAKEAFQDPTHVNIMTEDTMYLYFCEQAWGRIYGYDGSFKMAADGWLGLGGKYFCFMKKSDDHPIRNLDFVQK